MEMMRTMEMMKTIDKKALIPIHHTKKPDEFYMMPNFFTNYTMSEQGEIGCVYDPDTCKPLFRVVHEK